MPEEVVEKDLMIQEKDKLYVELKNILARQPGARGGGAALRLNSPAGRRRTRRRPRSGASPRFELNWTENS